MKVVNRLRSSLLCISLTFLLLASAHASGFSIAGGIGATLDLTNDGVLLRTVVPGSPAAIAGMQPGDVITEINSESVRGLDLPDVVPLLRGPVGSAVVLTISGVGLSQPVVVEVVRGDLTALSVNGGTTQAVRAEDWRGPDIEKLSQIKLPVNPTKEQIAGYVAGIAEVSLGQTSFSIDDPQIVMLLQVGAGNIDVLLGAPSQLAYYAEQVVSVLAEDEHKQLILDALANHPALIRLVIQKGWLDDARGILIRELQKRPGYLPRLWIEAVASFRDPQTYEDLKAYLVNGANRQWTYHVLSQIPDLNLTQAVGQAWAKAKAGCSDLERAAMAKIAQQYGHPDAFGVAIVR